MRQNETEGNKEAGQAHYKKNGEETGSNFPDIGVIHLSKKKKRRD